MDIVVLAFFWNKYGQINMLIDVFCGIIMAETKFACNLLIFRGFIEFIMLVKWIEHLLTNQTDKIVFSLNETAK